MAMSQHNAPCYSVTGIGARAGFGFPLHCHMLRHGFSCALD
jgi:hypothetical protein